MTTIVNLFGGPGSGKSTLAAGLFYEMKKRGMSVELVTEFVKDWAWEGKPIDIYSQPVIMGNQIQRETRLFGKVDYVITDSPVLIGGFYGEYYGLEGASRNSAFNYLNQRDDNGIKEINLFIPALASYQEQGRYQSKAEAEKIGTEMYDWLSKYGVWFTTVQTREPVDILKQFILRKPEAA